ncbi:glycosyltransferase family 2 protein [Pseudotamlana agarivorans]|uniref:glycosyltransferase family 2 protein n=1 Tax=Pseudotamlana agarivorans TaxID=481183 RepID=UPI00082E5575|nr:glycosyltransferase [Tamlana agarivorans]
MIAVSIIIPVYNCETYLADCLKSLISQTLKNMEFIFVNDGSRDKSEEIIQKFAKEDNRIQLINQPNQGVSVARNNGIQHAEGEYIGFVDGDDYVEPEMFNTLYLEAKQNNLDILISNFLIEGNQGTTRKASPFPNDVIYQKDFIKSQIVPYFLEKDDLNTCWNKLYTSKLIKSNNVTFPIGMTNGEDSFFNIQSFNNANLVKFINYYGYHYREVEGSATRDLISKDYFKLAVQRYQTNFKSLFKLDLSEEVINKLKAKRFVTNIISIIHLYISSEHAFLTKYKYVNNIVNNKLLRTLLNDEWHWIIENKNKYNKWVLKLIKQKSVSGLILLVGYSNFKNKK